MLVRSFARIHETNLKKQGMLPLTFAEPSDYERITGNDKISVLGLGGLAEGVPLTLRVTPGGGEQQHHHHHNNGSGSTNDKITPSGVSSATSSAREIHVSHTGGEPYEIVANHTFNDEQIGWFKVSCPDSIAS